MQGRAVLVECGGRADQSKPFPPSIRSWFVSGCQGIINAPKCMTREPAKQPAKTKDRAVAILDPALAQSDRINNPVAHPRSGGPGRWGHQWVADGLICRGTGPTRRNRADKGRKKLFFLSFRTSSWPS